MRTISLCIALLALAPAAAPAKDKDALQVFENRPLAIRTYRPSSSRAVNGRYRLTRYRLWMTPFVTETFDGKTVTLGVNFKTGGMSSHFTLASLAIVADEKQLYLQQHDWVGDQGGIWGYMPQTDLIDTDVIRQFCSAQNVYVSILIPGVAAPLNQHSFQLSPDQITDCRKVLAKFDELRSKILTQ